MIIHQEGGRSREIGGLADAQQATVEKHLVDRARVGGEPGRRRPSEKRKDDDPTPVVSVREKSAERTQHAVSNEKNRRQQSELGVGHRDRLLDRRTHRDEDHSVQIIKEGGDPQQRHHQPSLAYRVVLGLAHGESWTE